MSGLFVRSMSAGPMKSDDRDPYQPRELFADDTGGLFLVFGGDRVVHHALFRPRQTLCLEDYACMVSGSRAFERLRAERLAGRHRRKHDPRELVGQRHRNQPRRLLREKAGEPIVQGAFALAHYV